MVSTRDVAKRAGVSTGTVSNVLNYPERVTEAKRQRVVQAMADLGFVRNESARQLRSGQSNTIGFILIDAWNPFFGEVLRGIEASIDGRGMGLMVSNSRLSVDQERANIERFEQWRMRGVFVVPTGTTNLDALSRMKERGVATMLVDQQSPRNDLSFVAVNDLGGGELVGQHLKQIGARSIAYVGNPDVHTHAADRMHGLLKTQPAQFRRFDVPTVDIDSGRKAGRAISTLPGSERPDAVFCANDLVALGVMSSLFEANLRVPDDIFIVGYDDIDFAAQASVPLTTVRQPAYELGKRAAKVLLNEIDDLECATTTRLTYEPELVVRESTQEVARHREILRGSSRLLNCAD